MAHDSDSDDLPLGVGDLFVCSTYEVRTYDMPVRRRRGEDAVIPVDPSGQDADEYDALVSQPVETLVAASTEIEKTGTIVWLISTITAMYVAREAWRDVRGRDTLELGAGTALVGLTASKWAKSVVLTDYEEQVMGMMRSNLAHMAPGCRASVHALSWGDAADHAALAAATGMARYPVLLGADIVYWSDSVLPLVQSVSRLLARPKDMADGFEPVFIVGYTNRVDSMQRTLLDGMRAAGLKWTVVGFDWLDAATRERHEYFLRSMTLYRFTWDATTTAGQ